MTSFRSSSECFEVILALICSSKETDNFHDIGHIPTCPMMKSKKSLNLQGKNKISVQSEETSVARKAGTAGTLEGSNSRPIKKTSAASTRRAKPVRTVTRIVIGLALLMVLSLGVSLGSASTG